MSATYTDLTETNFPESVDNFMRMSDIASEDLTLINQYYTYLNAGNLSSAATLLYNNPSLQPKIFNAAKFNRLIDGVVAVQRFFKDDVDGYIEEKQTEFNDTVEEIIEDFEHVGEYDPERPYKERNIVDLYGGSFICKIDNAGQVPIEGTNTDYWGIITLRGQTGVSGTGLTPRGKWNPLESYSADDCVSHANALWQCLSDNTDSEPSTENLDWLSILDVETEALNKHIENTTIHVTAEEKQTWSGKQDPITVDNHLNGGSSNPIANNAVFLALQGKADLDGGKIPTSQLPAIVAVWG